MKKKAIVFVVICLLLFNFTVSAANFSDWINVQKSGDTNCTVTQSGKNVVFSGAGYYPTANTGVIYNNAIDPTNVSIEFTMDKFPAFYGAGGSDCWISVGIFNSKAYMDITNTAKTQGIVFLFRPVSDGSVYIEIMSLLNGETFGTHKTDLTFPSFKNGGSYKFELKADAQSGYAGYINGSRLKATDGSDVDMTWLNGVYTANTGYIALSVSDVNKKAMQISIKGVNGISAAGGDTAEDFTPSPVTTASSSDSASNKSSSNSIAASSNNSSNTAVDSTTTSSGTSSSNETASLSTGSANSSSTDKGGSNAMPVVIIIIAVIVVAGAAFGIYYSKKKKA